MKLRHIGVTVLDISESLEFYSKLGFQNIIKIQKESNNVISNYSNLENVVVRTYKIINSYGDLLELLDYLSPKELREYDSSKINKVGLSHFAITVKDLDSIYAEFKNNFVYEPQKSIDGKVKLAFCRDPNGVLIELVEEL